MVQLVHEWVPEWETRSSFTSYTAVNSSMGTTALGVKSHQGPELRKDHDFPMPSHELPLLALVVPAALSLISLSLKGG